MVTRIRYLRVILKKIFERLLRIFYIELMVRTIQELGHNDAAHLSAGIAYYSLLSLFPLLLGLMAILGTFLPSETVQKEIFDFLEANMPMAVDLVQRNIVNVIQFRSRLGIIGLGGVFWTGSLMFGAISRAINRAWNVHRDRPFYIRKLRDLGMTLGTSILFLISQGATAVFSVLHSFNLPPLPFPAINPNVNIASRLLAFFIILVIFLLLYKFIPNTKTHWRYIWTGALLAAVLFEASRNLLVLYLNNFAHYEMIYGSVVSIIALLIWMFFSAHILIFGAAFSAEYTRMRLGIRRGESITSDISSL
jgi:membrane protein